MTFQATSKKITKALAIAYLSIIIVWFAATIGCLIHELNHMSHSAGITAMEINFDGSGVTKAASFANEAHRWIYFNGYVIESVLIVVGLFSLLVIVRV